MTDTTPTDVFDEFVAAAARLREQDGAERITAHTSSVSIDDWDAVESASEQQ